MHIICMYMSISIYMSTQLRNLIDRQCDNFMHRQRSPIITQVKSIAVAVVSEELILHSVTHSTLFCLLCCSLLVRFISFCVLPNCAFQLSGEHLDELPLPQPRMQAPNVSDGTERLPKAGPVLQ